MVLQSVTLNGKIFGFDFSRHKKPNWLYKKKQPKKDETNQIMNLFFLIDYILLKNNREKTVTKYTLTQKILWIRILKILKNFDLQFLKRFS